MMSNIDVVCVGLVVADHVCAPIPHFPPAGALVTTERLELTIGGCAANTAVDLAKLGLKTSLVGRVGDDVLGRFCRDFLEERHVDCSEMVVSTTAQTAGTLIVNVAGDDRRFIHTVGANAELTGLEVSDDLLRRCKVLVIGGFVLNPALSGENVGRLFARAQELGVKTLLDVVIREGADVGEMLRPVLPYTDIFLPNTDEARMITGETDPLRQVRSLHDSGARVIVITRGRKGSLISCGESLYEAGAYQVEQVDGTGGGDAFAAGYIYGLLKGETDVRRCVQYGAAMGASCVRSMGATTGVFNSEELEAFVARYPFECSVRERALA